MTLFIFYLVLFLAGFLGAGFLLGRRLFALKSLTREEKKNELSGSPVFFDFLREMVYEPSLEFWANTAKPALLRAGEKTTRRSRILTLKVESSLHRLSENLRGKRIAIENGETANGNGSASAGEAQTGNGKNAEFWNEINEFKKELSVKGVSASGGQNGRKRKSKNSPS